MSDTTAKVVLDAEDRISPKLKPTADSFAKVSDAAKKAADGMSKGLDAAAIAAGHYVDANGRVRDAHGKFVAGVGDGNEKVKQSYNGLSGVVQAVVGKIGQAFSGVGTVVGKTAQAVKAGADKLGQAFASIGHAAERAAAVTIAAAGKIAKAIASAVAAAGILAIGIGVKSVKMAADFESTMNMFSAVAGDSLTDAGFSVNDFSEKALKLGADTKFSAQEAGDAMVNLAKGGVSMKAIMEDATKATLDLTASAGGKLGLAETADIVAKQLGVWAEKGVTATQVADLLAQAANASATDVRSLAEGLANVGGIAKASGVGFQDLVTALAGITPQFSSSAEAGTSLKSMLMAIADPSKDAKGAMRELGLLTFDYGKAQEYLAKQGIKTDGSARQINVALEKLTKRFKMSKKDAEAFFASFEQNQFYDAEGKFLGMANMAEKLKESLKGLSDQDKNKLLGDIFGTFGINSATALAAMGEEGFGGMAKGMEAAGTAAEQAAKMQKGLNAALEAMKGSIDTVFIRLGTLLLPVLTRIVTDGITPLINSFGDLIAQFQGGADPIAVIYTMLENAFGTDTAEIVSDIAKAITTLFTTISGGGNLATFGNTLKTMVVSGVGESIANIAINAQWLYDTIVANWPMISATATTVFNTITTTISSWWTTISPILAQVAGAIITGFGAAMTWLTTNWPQISTIVTSVFNGVVGFVQGTLIPVIGTIVETFASVVAWVTTNWPLISNTISTVIGIVKTIFTTVLMPQIQWAIDLFKEIVGWVQTNWPLIASTFEAGMPLWKGILGALVLAFVTTWEMIKASIGSIITLILGLLKASMQLMQGDTEGALNTLFETFKKIFNKILEAVKVPISMIAPYVSEKFGEIKSFLAAQVSTFYELGKNVVMGLLKSVQDFGGIVKDKIIEMVMGPLNHIKTLLGIHSPSDEMYWMGQMVALGLADGIVDSIGAVKDAMAQMHTAMFDAFGSPSMQFAGDAGAAIGAILSGSDGGATGAVNDALSAIGANPPGADAPSHADEAPTVHIGTINVNNQADADYLVNKLRDHWLRR